MHLNGKLFHTTGKSSTLFISLAHWDETVFGSPPTALNADCLQTCGGLHPVNIHYFASVSFSFDDNIAELPIAVCSWYRPLTLKLANQFKYGVNSLNTQIIIVLYLFSL